jgi:glycerol-3-phosphate dehydrogenase
MAKQHVVVIGAGSTGAAIAHDLALRGLRVTLIERFGPAAGTTGHNQAQLHSAFECTEVCPAGVEPALAIMNLRKELRFSVIKRKGK